MPPTTTTTSFLAANETLMEVRCLGWRRIGVPCWLAPVTSKPQTKTHRAAPPNSMTSYGNSVFRCPNGLDLNWQQEGYPMVTSHTDGRGSMFWRIDSSNSIPVPITGDSGFDTWYCMNGLWDPCANEFPEYPFIDVDTTGSYLGQGRPHPRFFSCTSCPASSGTVIWC